MNSDQSNPYQRTKADIKDPPKTISETTRYLGPGFILSASIVGSGELIATTHLGAQAGFITLWVILVSCLAKVAVQLEFGRHAIATVETTMESLNRLPGLKIGKAHWTVWAWLVLMSAKILQVGGIVGGVALILKIFFPMISVVWLTIGVAIIVAVLVFQGQYKLIEKASLEDIAKPKIVRSS
jgi:Mn2+/Fe2+ NRAMP family transporter